jgi:cell division protein FtsA
MSLQDGITPKMKPVSPRRSALVAGLDIGTSKIVCIIARLKPQTPQEALRRRTHGIEILGIGHTEARGIKGGEALWIGLTEIRDPIIVDPVDRSDEVRVF